jgi:hypothetical protein
MGERVEGEQKGVQLIKIGERNEIGYRGKGGGGKWQAMPQSAPYESPPKEWGRCHTSGHRISSKLQLQTVVPAKAVAFSSTSTRGDSLAGMLGTCATSPHYFTNRGCTL